MVPLFQLEDLVSKEPNHRGKQFDLPWGFGRPLLEQALITRVA